MLQYLKRKEIDAAKWNHCVDVAPHALLYARTEYLDAMADHWDAVVLDDYKAVMPLPYKIKWGLRYVTMPAFVQQLGIFSCDPVSHDLQSAFIEMAEKKFRFGDYHFHYGHTDPRFQSRNNFVLSLQASYDAIKSHYRQDLVKNLSRAQKFQIQYREATDLPAIIRLYRFLYQDRQPGIRACDYHHFEQLCMQLRQNGQAVLRAVYDANEVLAAAVCLKDAGRLYLLLSANSVKGRSMEANHLLIDCLIHEFSGSRLLFDFEGSEVPGIAHFYKNFGSMLQPYFYYRWNRLPWPLRLLKQ